MRDNFEGEQVSPYVYVIELRSRYYLGILLSVMNKRKHPGIFYLNNNFIKICRNVINNYSCFKQLGRFVYEGIGATISDGNV